MKELILSSNDGRMSSLEISEITGKRHDNIVRDIRNLLSQGVNALNFEETYYTDKSNRKSPCFSLTKKGCLILASGYDAKLRERIVDRWEELEKEKQSGGFQVPRSFSQALLLAAQQAEQIEKQQLQISVQQKQIETMNEKIIDLNKKADYLEIILQSKETVTTTQIAQDYGMSARTFNKLLSDFRIQRKVNGQWIIYNTYNTRGYVHSHTTEITHKDGSKGTVLNTEWRQSGRIFLYEFLKNKDILPLIEKSIVERATIF